MYLSVVIPAYNEVTRIGTSLSQIHNFLKEKGYNYEILVIDDGSNDKTLELLSEYSQKISNLIVLKNESNQGKGFSIKKGILKSRGDIVLFTDADMSTPIEEIEKLIPYINEGYSIAIGSRALPDSKIKIHQACHREFMGKIFNKIIRIILNLDYYDTQCGFKCFKREAALETFKLMKFGRFSFDVEILFIAKNIGLKVKEVPVCWYNSPESKVRLIRDSLKMLWDVLMIRFYSFKE